MTHQMFSSFVLGMMAAGVAAQAAHAGVGPVCCPGDLSGNGLVQVGDISPFVQVLLTSAGTAEELCAADVNLDGAPNGKDVAPFVNALLSGASCSGACCRSFGVCEILTEASCISQGGCFQGAGTVCSPNPCACPLGFCNTDGACANGCETNINNNPACPGTNLGSVSGDTGAGILNQAGVGEAWYHVLVTENNSSNVYLSVWVDLQSNPGSNYDLFVRCAACASSIVGSSNMATGQLDRVMVRWDDDFIFPNNEDDSGFIIIEVRWVSGGCDGWTLTVRGNQIVTTVNCNQ